MVKKNNYVDIERYLQEAVGYMEEIRIMDPKEHAKLVKLVDILSDLTDVELYLPEYDGAGSVGRDDSE